MNEALPTRERLRWQCRRGMLELDLVLSAYLESRYSNLDDAGKQRFVDLLSVDDPTLNAWMFGNQSPVDAEMVAVIADVLSAAVEN
ncbi:MAG: succinate dehydrogenase assembly factor 2 [Gammaproteobacteria bacterium]|nr:succinate dehydrogenase assembly factor 2 [Gammaproteobacteria bacterium]